MSYIQKIIGKNLKKYRKLNNLTLEKLEEKIGINYQNISKIEQGKSFMTASTFEKICQVLQISPAQLVSLEDSLPQKADNKEIILILQQLINSMNSNRLNAYYKLTLAFIEATKLD